MFDLVVSWAAFEHFDNVDMTIEKMSNKIQKGGSLFFHVDMKTHSRWINVRDPLNIYRYSDTFWRLFRFSGSPNRVRSEQYRKSLENNEWKNIAFEPRTIMEKEYVKKVINSLDKNYRKMGISEMHILSFVVMATKK
jgi:hypothetical protein